MDEWIYFLKNSEVKDEFTAKGLKEAGEVLDYMRLPEDDQFSYNRYLDYLHYKASEIISLQSEAEDRVRQDERLKAKIELVENLISKSTDDEFIAEVTGLTLEQIKDIRANLAKK